MAVELDESAAAVAAAAVDAGASAAAVAALALAIAVTVASAATAISVGSIVGRALPGRLGVQAASRRTAAARFHNRCKVRFFIRYPGEAICLVNPL